MTKLAAEYSLSDVALHKICRKHDVRTAAGRYWAKKAHGKSVKIAPLLRREEADSITIREGEASEEGVAFAEARAGVRATIADWQPVEEAPWLGPGRAPPWRFALRPSATASIRSQQSRSR